MVGIRKKSIENFKKEIDAIKDKIIELKKENDKKNTEIIAKEDEINNHKPKISDIIHSLSQFKIGWLECLEANKYSETTIQEANIAYESKIKEYNLIDHE